MSGKRMDIEHQMEALGFKRRGSGIHIQTQTQIESESIAIDKKRKKILYAEADKKFVDFLFTILALPVGTMVKLVSSSSNPDNKPMAAAGSLESLYRSVGSLSLTILMHTTTKRAS
ncbi:hypothetical protein Csa_000433 [Cucumis sativus]|nr:hypothetical protein Csa_000433 [Cucumis sativus]